MPDLCLYLPIFTSIRQIMLEDLQKHLDKIMQEQNTRSIPDFEGYSPAEMHDLLHFTFEESSPISFQP